jgi:hypothetical protein
MQWKFVNREIDYLRIKLYCRRGWRLPTDLEVSEYLKSNKLKVNKFWVKSSRPHSEFLAPIYDNTLDCIIYTYKDKRYNFYLCKEA